MAYPMDKKSGRITWLLLAAALCLLWGCAHHQPLPEESLHWVYQTDGGSGSAFVERWAPAFVAFGHAERVNRIGQPKVRLESDGDQMVYVDPEEPVIYYMKRPFTTEKASYTNLIYRIHFPGVPFSLIPFNLTAGRNVGLLVVVTLDHSGRPVLVTSVGTCGCYKAVVPTEYLARDAYPAHWKSKPLDIYGEQLPPILNFRGIPAPRIMVYLRPGVHRVMNLEVRDDTDLTADPFRTVPMKAEAMERLERLPVDGGTTSFYHDGGMLKGHVKGSVKPWETLFMSLISLDLFVGTDKAYADTARTGNPFYTSLKPWRRQDSNMWDFARFLHYWGWRL
jgi:hypothetical protein